ncbi:TolC family protein [Sneathiella sp.]|uniref:TolC family protein n=1 Tax=Sneathiella sp. TaxID=1964365 RepID=UPI003569729D
MSKLLRFISTAILCTGVFVTSSHSDEAPLLSLEDALTIVRLQNPQVQNAKIQIDVVGDQTDAMRTKRYPQLTANVRGFQNFVDNEYTFEQGSLGTVGVDPVPSSTVEIGTTNGFSTHYSLTATQPLMDLYQIGLNVDKLEMQQDIARQQSRQTRQSISLQVKQLYYQILSNQSAVEATDATLEFDRELVKILKDNVAQKTELEYQLLNAEAQLASTQHKLLSQKNDIITSKQQLNSLLGRDISTPFSVSAVPADPMARYTADTATEQALAQRPDTEQARLQVKVAENDVAIQKSAYLPEVNLVANYGRSENTTLLPDESMYVGVIAKWEFITWGRNESQVSGSKRAVTQARNSLRDNEDQIRAQVSADIRNLEVAKQLIPVTQMAQKASEEKLRVSLNQYKEKSILLSDLLDARSELSAANNDYQQAQLAVWNAAAQLQNALGEE